MILKRLYKTQIQIKLMFMIRLVFACINIGFFPLKRKKVNVVPVY